MSIDSRAVGVLAPTPAHDSGPNPQTTSATPARLDTARSEWLTHVTQLRLWSEQNTSWVAVRGQLMRGATIVIAVLCGAPLSGCSSMLTPAADPLPDWAMNQQSVYQEAPADLHARTAIERPTGTAQARKSRSPVSLASRKDSLADGRPYSSSEVSADDVRAGQLTSPFTSEWYAHEGANEARLRRHLHICTGC
jgi:hypothetical protein